MRVLVTGCAGFIGASVTSKLLERGDEVVGVDNLNDYYDPRLKHWRLESVRKGARFLFYHMDITDNSALQRIFAEHKFSAVVNLAARAGVRASITDPWAYNSTNVTGTLNLLECSRHHGVEKFVLASTSSLYAGHSPPFSEDIRTDFALAPYSASKKAAEVLCYSYHHLYGLHVAVPRYFTVYGPAGRPDMSIFKFIRRIERGEELEVFGTGAQTRGFTYIDDIADGTVRALELTGYEIVNLGSDTATGLLAVIALIERALTRTARIRHAPMHPADVPDTCADITKARQLLRWEPHVGIDEGIERTVEWYMQNRSWLQDIAM